MTTFEKYYERFFILSFAIVWCCGLSAQNNTWLSRQEAKMKTATIVKPKKKINYKKRTSVKHIIRPTSKQKDDVDNSEYYQDGLTKDAENSINYYNVGYDNHIYNNEYQRTIHLDIDYPSNNLEYLDFSIRTWICNLLEQGEIVNRKKPSESVTDWLQVKYPSDYGNLSDGERLLRYYDDQYFKTDKKMLPSFGFESDSVTVNLVDETDKYISYCFRCVSRWSPSSNGYHEEAYNMTFRKRDGVKMGWDLIKADAKTALSDKLREAFQSLIGESTEDDKSQYEELLKTFSDQIFPLPNTPPILTNDGMEFDYPSLSDYQATAYYKGLNIVIPYSDLWNLMSPKAIVLISDKIDDAVINNICYHLYQDKARIVGTNNNISAEVVIPAIIDYGDFQFHVVSLEAKAFSGKTILKSIMLPESITAIGESCFSGCTSLRSFISPQAVSHIGKCCFFNCTSLISASLNNEMREINPKMFSGCTSLSLVTFPKVITKLGNDSFYHCSDLKYITIPQTIISLGDHCFSHCTALRDIKLGNNIQEMGKSCFESCTSLSYIKLPSNLSVLQPKTFMNCTKLDSIALPESIIILGDSCFLGCNEMNGIRMSNFLSNIGKSCFKECISLHSINIPQKVRVIGEGCFSYCSSLALITCHWLLPSSINVDPTAFDYIYLKAILTVPKKTKKLYKDIPVWMNMKMKTEKNGEADPEDL